MTEISIKERKQVRELLDLANTRELSRALMESLMFGKKVSR